MYTASCKTWLSSNNEMHFKEDFRHMNETNELKLKQFKLSSHGSLLQHLTYIELVMTNPALDQSREEEDSKKHKTDDPIGLVVFIRDWLPQPYKGNMGIAAMSFFTVRLGCSALRRRKNNMGYKLGRPNYPFQGITCSPCKGCPRITCGSEFYR
ncbi:hypothetical protein D5086_012608 [Populus alba]|uniref:Uncharacterized protein n=1 Tax=Populus alba TaxID=43335 RepID=A0ACC4C3E7_POPAL